jgi:hypothetical protein
MNESYTVQNNQIVGVNESEIDTRATIKCNGDIEYNIGYTSRKESREGQSFFTNFDG